MTYTENNLLSMRMTYTDNDPPSMRMTMKVINERGRSNGDLKHKEDRDRDRDRGIILPENLGLV